MERLDESHQKIFMPIVCIFILYLIYFLLVILYFFNMQEALSEYEINHKNTSIFQTHVVREYYIVFFSGSNRVAYYLRHAIHITKGYSIQLFNHYTFPYCLMFPDNISLVFYIASISVIAKIDIIQTSKIYPCFQKVNSSYKMMMSHFLRNQYMSTQTPGILSALENSSSIERGMLPEIRILST